MLNELKNVGLEGKKETFKIASHHPIRAVLEVMQPYQQTYEASVYGLTGNTPEDGIIADLTYVDDANPTSLQGCEGKVVLVNKRITAKKYKHLAEAKVAGFISWGGEIYRREDMPLQSIRPMYYEKHGKIPGVSIFAEDAADMVTRHADKVRLVVKQEEFMVDSSNVIAEITGQDKPEEVIVIGAHYDSVAYSQGANDNGAGSVIIMELARHFAVNPPKRTLRFMWYGSEEYGLLGSFAYVQAHHESLQQVQFMLNCDVAGAILGHNLTIVTGSDEIKHQVDFLAKMIGLDMTIKQDVYSSDSVPFAQYDIPSINLLRVGAPIHNRYDQLQYISAEQLGVLSHYALLFLCQIDEAKVFPFKRELPEDIKKKLKEYLERAGRDGEMKK